MWPADLISQAEHDVLAASVLVTDSLGPAATRHRTVGPTAHQWHRERVTGSAHRAAVRHRPGRRHRHRCPGGQPRRRAPGRSRRPACRRGGIPDPVPPGAVFVTAPGRRSKPGRLLCRIQPRAAHRRHGARRLEWAVRADLPAAVHPTSGTPRLHRGGAGRTSRSRGRLWPTPRTCSPTARAVPPEVLKGDHRDNGVGSDGPCRLPG